MLDRAGVPPAAYVDDFGPYRSPLKSNDGSPVRTPEDWKRRRAEILAAWTAAMGRWPALLERPRVERLGAAQPEGESFERHRVRVQVARGQSLEGYLLVPLPPPGSAGAGGAVPRRPAVLTVFYDPETLAGLAKDPDKARGRDFALELARRGFVTLAIGSPGGDARRPDTDGNATLQPLSYLAYVAANCHTALSQMPEVDPRRIGVVGHSYGGKWALFAAALHEPFAAVAVSDPGVAFDEGRPNVNYWEKWYLGLDPALEEQRTPGLVTKDNPRTGAYKRLVEEGRDLHELMALIAPRPLLVSGGSEDPAERWRALNHVRAVSRLLGHDARVFLTTRPGHSPTEQSNAVVWAFFERFLAGRR